MSRRLGRRLALGGAVALLAWSLVWFWPRERSLAVVALTAAAGSWAPIAVSAARHHLPLVARLRGAWALTGADVVGIAVPVALALLWLGIKEHIPSPTRTRGG